MLFHMSISAEDPQHVAQVIAELWKGEARRFPPVSDNGWIALAGDERGTAIEVYPQGTVLRETDGDADARGEPSGTDRFSATHAAIATELDTSLCWPSLVAKDGLPNIGKEAGCSA